MDNNYLLGDWSIENADVWFSRCEVLGNLILDIFYTYIPTFGNIEISKCEGEIISLKYEFI